MLKPKLFSTIKNYNLKQFYSDLTAGAIVGIVALPLAIAFAIASGVPPEKGLITAIVGGFLVSFLGGSRVQIGGPTGAFVVIIYGIIQSYGFDGLMVATIMAGIILVIMGFSGFGSVIKFIPHPVIVGFTSGIAVLIFSTQIKDFFGLSISKVPAGFMDKCFAYAAHFSSINYYALSIAAGSLLAMILWPKISRKIPGSLIALILGTAAVRMFNLPVETIGSRFGEISSSIPMPHLPNLTFDMVKNLIMPATTIAILAAVESLLSALVADGMTGGHHQSNVELVAQGLANIFSPIFGGIPVTGAIARTATNIKNGGRTPVAGIAHALVLLLIMLFFGRFASLIPMASLSAILVMVAYNMSQWRSFRAVLRNPRSDVAVLVTTFGLTVIIDLTVAIEVGMVMAVFLFMRRMALVTNVGVLTREFSQDDAEGQDPNAIEHKSVPAGVEVFEINGPFFFGAVDKFKEAVSLIEKPPKILIIRMRNVPAIDSTGIHTLEETYKDAKRGKTRLLLSGVHTQPLVALEQSGFLHALGEENVFGNIDDTLDRARELLGMPKEGRPANFIPTVKRDLV